MIDNPQQPESTSENFEAPPTEESIHSVNYSKTSEQPSEPSPGTDVLEVDVADATGGGRLEDTISTLQQELATLKQQLQEQSQQAESYKAQSMRIAADFDNFRKRNAKEKESLEQQIKRNTLGELLSVIDNFERARSQIKPANDGEMAIHKSYQGVYKNLVDSLKRIGVSAMRPEGQPFDPNYHEALFREQTNEYPEDTVIEQLVRGYLIGDQVLRHAMVKVAVAPEPADSQAESIAPEDLNLAE